MKKTVFVTFAILAFAGAVFSAPLPDDVLRNLIETIRKHCPEATIEVTADKFLAKHGTMMFIIHNESKTGEFFSQTCQREGPNFKGFILAISLYDGRYEGAASVPQTIRGPYFSTFIDAPAAEEGKKHYQIHFSYGGRLDPALKKAILDSIPKTGF